MLIEWDKSQREVIDTPPEDRLLVGAGPGTGKTAVACARVSQLIDSDSMAKHRT
jgi:superfamily I DNA/RNA helicase